MLLGLLQATTRASGVVGSFAIWAITIAVSYDVIARFLGEPTLWAMEVSSHLMVLVAILAAGETLRHGGHFEVRLLVKALPSRLRAFVDIGVSVISTGFIALFCYGTIELLEHTFRYDARSPTLLQIPLIYPRAILCLGALVLLFAFIDRVVKAIRALGQRNGAT